MISVKDIAWLAGLLEGEGSFFTASHKRQPKLALGMTDEDVVRRASLLMGGVAICKTKPQHPNKPQYKLVLAGGRAVGVMMTIYSFMGARRKAAIQQVIAEWKSRPVLRRRGLSIVNCAHTSRRHYADGRCHSCYEHLRRHKKAA